MEAVSLGSARFSDADAAAFDEQVEHDAQLMRRVAALARRFVRKYPDIRKGEDDLLQEARCAMAASLSKYDPGRNVYKSAYLFRCAQNALAKILRNERRECRSSRMERSLHFPDGRVAEFSAYHDATGAIDSFNLNNDPELSLLARERARIEEEAIADVRAELSEFDQSVFDCFTSPSPALLVLVRNLAGDSEKMSRSHIALHLRCKVEDVNYSVRKIRLAAEAVMARMERERDFR